MLPATRSTGDCPAALPWALVAAQRTCTSLLGSACRVPGPDRFLTASISVIESKTGKFSNDTRQITLFVDIILDMKISRSRSSLVWPLVRLSPCRPRCRRTVRPAAPDERHPSVKRTVATARLAEPFSCVRQAFGLLGSARPTPRLLVAPSRGLSRTVTHDGSGRFSQIGSLRSIATQGESAFPRSVAVRPSRHRLPVDPCVVTRFCLADLCSRPSTPMRPVGHQLDSPARPSASHATSRPVLPCPEAIS